MHSVGLDVLQFFLPAGSTGAACAVGRQFMELVAVVCDLNAGRSRGRSAAAAVQPGEHQ
jgi:hypothetical protein